MPAWTRETRQRAMVMLEDCADLGEIAEALDCSVFTVQAELDIGGARDVRAQRRARGVGGD